MVVFAKQERSEADFYIQEAEIRKGAVLSDPGHACKYNRHCPKIKNYFVVVVTCDLFAKEVMAENYFANILLILFFCYW